MKLYAFYIVLQILGICLTRIEAQSSQRPSEAPAKPLKCHQSLKQSAAALQAENDQLKSRLEKMEKTLRDHLQNDTHTEQLLQELATKWLAMEEFLVQSQSEHNKKLKETLNSAAAKKCQNPENFVQSYNKFSQLQKRLEQKFDVKLQDLADDENEIDTEELPDEKVFCDDFYERTVEKLSANISVLQNINEKLKESSEAFTKESLEHKKDMESLPDVLKYLEEKDASPVCVRTKDKETICSPLPHPTSAAQYDSLHCFGNKCVIKNFLYGPDSFPVVTDQTHEGGDWMIIQRRINGDVDFYRNWTEYQAGFGNMDGEFWLGLDKIHALTKALAPVELLIQLQDHQDVMKYAKFGEFLIGNETELYELKKAEYYKGNAGNSFSLHKGQKFTTKDKDNDEDYSYNCAQGKTGAWWYSSCLWSNLNGFYYKNGLVPSNEAGRGVCWYSFHGYKYSLKSVQMMIRPRKDYLGDVEF